MINWLTWRDPPFKEFVLSRSIRRCALELAKIEGLEWSSDTAAFLLVGVCLTKLVCYIL